MCGARAVGGGPSKEAGVETLSAFLSAAGVTLAGRLALLRRGEQLAVQDADAPCGPRRVFLHLLCADEQPTTASSCTFVPPAPPRGEEHTYKWWAIPAGSLTRQQVGHCVSTETSSRQLEGGEVSVRGAPYEGNSDTLGAASQESPSGFAPGEPSSVSL